MTARASPDRIYAELFEHIQSSRLLGDSKTFADATARSDPADILAAYRSERERPDFDLASFVSTHFELPASEVGAATDPAGLPVVQRIEHLWELLTRGPDDAGADAEGRSSLIPLPNRYVVPGGRFREVYYWDSYFTMLGLAASGRVGLIADMVGNFAHLIDETGFIPNGNRTYYCTRSQPPFFALMVELLAEVSRDDAIYARYLPRLKREYAFWMDGADALSHERPTHRRVVLTGDGPLNRYWDDVATPRPESHAEDSELAASVAREPEALYRDIRAGAESGWDYSSRWFDDERSMAAIRTTQIVPVDLNSLLYNLEATLARVCDAQGEYDNAATFAARARNRRHLLRSLFFDHESGMFMDLSLADFDVTGVQSLAAAYPLFFGIATEQQAASVARCIHRDLLKAGGWVTTNNDTGQQWDSPNGWAPLQWITCRGLERYGFHDEARAGARRWIDNNIAIYREHGRLLEKYDVVSTGLAGGGGEYEVQDGFGWTNAVLLCLMREQRGRV